MKLITLTTKQIFVTLGTVIGLSLIVSCGQKQPSPDDKLPIDVKVIEREGGGWEYDIYVDHKLYIKQDRIPAVQGLHGFASKADAEKAAKLVVKRIKEGVKPAVTVQELKDLGITLPEGQ